MKGRSCCWINFINFIIICFVVVCCLCFLLLHQSHRTHTTKISHSHFYLIYSFIHSEKKRKRRTHLFIFHYERNENNKKKFHSTPYPFIVVHERSIKQRTRVYIYVNIFWVRVGRSLELARIAIVGLLLLFPRNPLATTA